MNSHQVLADVHKLPSRAWPVVCADRELRVQLRVPRIARCHVHRVRLLCSWRGGCKGGMHDEVGGGFWSL